MLLDLAEATLCQSCRQNQALELSERWIGTLDDWFCPSEWGVPSGVPLSGGCGSLFDSRFNPHKNEGSGRGGSGSRGGGINREHRPQAESTAQPEQPDNGNRARARRPRGGRSCGRDGHEQAIPEAEGKTPPEQSRCEARQKEERRQRQEQEKTQEEEKRKRQEQEKKRQEEEKKRQEDEGKRHEEDKARRATEELARRHAKERHVWNAQQSWSAAWATYENACNVLADPQTRPTDITDLQVVTVDFWPTRVGSYSSCTEADVKEFFAYRRWTLDRKAMSKHAVIWHPDRVMNLFRRSRNKEAIRETVTMISQVVNGIVDTCSELS